jgi:hypothetical protein
MNKKTQDMADTIVRAYQNTKERVANRCLEEGVPVEIAQLEFINRITQNFLKSTAVFLTISEELPEGVLTRLTPKDIVEMFTHYIASIEFVVLEEQEKPHAKESRATNHNSGHLN